MAGILTRFSFGAMTRVVVLVLGVALVALAVSFHISRQGIVSAEQEWLSFQAQSARKLAIYNQMRVEIGFGGLIHNFKNYLLRKEVFYRNEVYLRAQTMHDLIGEYRTLQITEVESEALKLIEEVVNKLEGSMAVAESLFETGIPLESIDTQIAFDEVPSVWALDALAEVALQEQTAGEQRLVNALRVSIDRTTWIGLSVIICFAISILLFLLAMRVTVGRLEQTTRAVNAIAGGNPDVEVQYLDERNEIGDLARGAVAFKHALDQVQETNSELGRTIQQLEATMEKAVQAEKMASLGQLVAGVAHEINTPLGVAITANSILPDEAARIREEISDERPSRNEILQIVDRVDEATRLVTDNLDRAARMVASFRQVAADQHNETVSRVDLASFLKQLYDTLQPMVSNRDVRIHMCCPEGLQVSTYPGVLSQMLTQFTLNSLDHAFANGQAGEIRIEMTPSENGGLELVYSDNGRGVPAEVRGRIFDPFYTTSRGGGRTGLGLHVVFNQVVKVLRGSITCEQPEGGGLRFRALVPPVPETSGEGA